jgi:hypothetical protein
MKTDYNKQANDFLHKYELNLSVREAIPQKTPLWHKDGERHGVNYFCSLSNKDGKHYSFDFWGSIHDLNTGKKPTAYDVLACLDTYSADSTFEDFCDNYGYDIDSIKAMKTYEATQKQCRGLESILSKEAEAELNNIN